MPRPTLKPLIVERYAGNVKEDNLHAAFAKHITSISFFKEIPPEKWSYRYAEGKWSIKELVQHIIDAERIFSYRALVIARKDTTTPLVSYEENDYAAASNADNRSREKLLAELEVVQHATRTLFQSFDEEQLMSTGKVTDYIIEVNGIGFALIGHTLHHIQIIKERYLV